jgi:Flp pilus assembly protein TadD
MERWLNGQLQDAVEQFEQIPPGTPEFLEIQPALGKLYDQLGNRYFSRLRFVRAIKNWSASDRIQRNIKDSVDES